MKLPTGRSSGLFEESGLRRYFANTSWMMAQQVLRLLVGLFIGIYVARYLGPAQFGLYSFALAFVALLEAFAALGLNNVVIRELVKHDERREELLGTSFWLKAAGGTGIVVLLAIILPCLGTLDAAKLYILIVSGTLIFKATEVVDFHFQSIVQAKYSAICRSIQLAISAIIKITLIVSEARLLWFVLAVLIDSITLAGAYVFMTLRKHVVQAAPRFVWPTAKQLLSESWPMLITGLAVMVYMRIDQVMIQYMLGERQVGIYSAAVKLSEVWYFVPVTICASLYPAVIRSREVSQLLYIGRLKRLYGLIIILSVSVALAAFFASDLIVRLLYGAPYSAAASVLKIHIWAGVFVAIGVANSKWFLAENKVRIQAAFTVVGAIVNVILNLVLLPRLGVNGAAIATLIAYAVAGYVLLATLKTTRGTFIAITTSLFPTRDKR